MSPGFIRLVRILRAFSSRCRAEIDATVPTTADVNLRLSSPATVMVSSSVSLGINRECVWSLVPLVVTVGATQPVQV